MNERLDVLGYRTWFEAGSGGSDERDPVWLGMLQQRRACGRAWGVVLVESGWDLERRGIQQLGELSGELVAQAQERQEVHRECVVTGATRSGIHSQQK